MHINLHTFSRVSDIIFILIDLTDQSATTVPVVEPSDMNVFETAIQNVQACSRRA